MNLRVLATAAGLLGGLCWLVRWVADLAGADPGWEGVRWAGLVLLAVAVAAAGAVLVSAAWLRALVAVAATLLAWSVYTVVGGDAASTVLDGLVGLVAVVLAGASWVVRRRSREDPEPPRRRHGAHSAR